MQELHLILTSYKVEIIGNEKDKSSQCSLQIRCWWMWVSKILFQLDFISQIRIKMLFCYDCAEIFIRYGSSTNFQAILTAWKLYKDINVFKIIKSFTFKLISKWIKMYRQKWQLQPSFFLILHTRLKMEGMY